MSDPRPTVDPIVVSAAIDGAPDRVRRRLDRTPDAAASWEWAKQESGWSVAAGNELVTLPSEHIGCITDVGCSCLLSPNCFHIMACLTALEVDAQENAAEIVESTSSTTNEAANTIELETEQQQAAVELMQSVRRLMSVGITGAGVTVQSGLMRAVHQCRAQGLHRAAAVGLRVVEGTRQVRRSSADADPVQLAADIADCVETAHRLLHNVSVESFWVGTARRKFYPVKPKRLYGLLAEPILTRSGFAGAAVYLLGEDDAIYSVSDVRPGGAELCRGAYRGGIDIGPMVEPAIRLARSQYLTSDVTASRDGRLGRGKSVKIAKQGVADWNSAVIQQRFAVSLYDQWDRVYQQTSLPPDVRPAGWDFVFVTGSVLGAVGSELLLQLAGDDKVIRLAIANDAQDLCFRENLRMLSHAPGLQLRVIGRLDLNHPTMIAALAVAGVEPDIDPDESEPRFDLPDEVAGRIHLGLDPIARHSLLHAQPKPVVLGEMSTSAPNDPLLPLRRRWVATMLGGTSSQYRTVTNTIAREIALLDRAGYATGASLLDAISRDDTDAAQTFLAAAIYLRSSTSALARAQASIS